jgi:hypothetical protein
MLFVFAWSGVAFTLPQAYMPVMKAFFRMSTDETMSMDDTSFAPAKPLEVPALGWREAYATGQKLMREASVQHGFAMQEEKRLFYDPDLGVYGYVIHSSVDLNTWDGTIVLFDGNTGALRSLSLRAPSAEARGDVITRWLIWLHMAAVFGRPMQIVVCAMGFGVAVLSATGVIVWWLKRKSAHWHRQRVINARGS